MYETDNTLYYCILFFIFIWIIYREYKNGAKISKILKEFGVAFLIIFFIRSFVIDIFQVPSGSMVNNLLVGDIPTVRKWSYGYNQFSLWLSEFYASNKDYGKLFESLPKRGDIIVFRLPSQPNINFVKRIVGLPGDRVQVKKGVVYINNEPAKMIPAGEYLYQDDNNNNVKYVMQQYKETLPGSEKEHIIIKLKNNINMQYLETINNTNVYYVPKDHYFVMGDNRDFSNDSRNTGEVGYVHKKFIIGEVGFVLLSMGNGVKIYEPHRWLFNFRYERFFKWVY